MEDLLVRLILLEGGRDVLQLSDVAVEELDERLTVCVADLLPHLRAGAGDSGDITEAAGSEGLHELCLIIGILHDVDEGARDDVWKV